MPHIPAGKVVSPKKQWQLVDVIIDQGAGQPAYAIGTWEGERRVGFRWNGTEENPLGNPQSRGLPTWTMLSIDLHPAVVALTPTNKQQIVASFLEMNEMVELVVDRHPSGNRTLKERSASTRMYRDLEGDLFSNRNEASFYRAVAKELGDRMQRGQTVFYKDTELG